MCVGLSCSRSGSGDPARPCLSDSPFLNFALDMVANGSAQSFVVGKAFFSATKRSNAAFFEIGRPELLWLTMLGHSGNPFTKKQSIARYAFGVVPVFLSCFRKHFVFYLSGAMSVIPRTRKKCLDLLLFFCYAWVSLRHTHWCSMFSVHLFGRFAHLGFSPSAERGHIYSLSLLRSLFV